MSETEIVAKLTEVDSRSKSNTHRIDDLEKQQNALTKLATAVEVLATEQRHQTSAIEKTNDNVSKLDTKLEALEKVPAKRWEQVIGIVMGIVVAYLLGSMGVR